MYGQAETNMRTMYRVTLQKQVTEKKTRMTHQKQVWEKRIALSIRNKHRLDNKMQVYEIYVMLFFKIKYQNQVSCTSSKSSISKMHCAAHQ